MLGLHLGKPEEGVARETSFELAKRAKEISGCSLSAAITGYMGPTGGTKEDPIGTLYCCVMGAKTIEEKINLPNWDRETLQWGASTNLLRLIWQCAG